MAIGKQFCQEAMMEMLIRAVLEGEEKSDFQQFIQQLMQMEQASPTSRCYLLRNQILQAFANYCQTQEKPIYYFRSSALGGLIHAIHEMLLEPETIWLVLRTRIASQEIWQLQPDLSEVAPASIPMLLAARDRQGRPGNKTMDSHQQASPLLEINFAPFHRATPNIDDPRNIGQGLSFLNHYLCDQLSNNHDYWVEALFSVLRQQEVDGISLLIGDRLPQAKQLHEAVVHALQKVGQLPPETPYVSFHPAMQELGLEPGWGNNAGRVYETLELLDRLLTTPSPALLEAFVSRIPAVLRVVLVSIHGWVGQEEVLGRAETMGQVVYVLEQARALEQQLREDVELAGLSWLGIQPNVTILTRLIQNCEGTFCNQRLEKLEDSENGWILRVPFRAVDEAGDAESWVSKFAIWPYLEAFAEDAIAALEKHLGGRPNLVVGHYSDGNLVAFLLAKKFQAIQCNIAHSLEKSRYLFSDLYWQSFEERYHFSAQFTADLISMNAADFIIASSYQEIVGTPDTIGQYESYKCFTMPQLYHVVDGINLFSPRFNVVPPGINQSCYFPYTQQELRDGQNLRAPIQELLFERQDAAILGELSDPKKRLILAVGSISQTNNQTGLLEWFAQYPALRERCNLILLTNKIHITESSTPEEAQEIEKLHHLIAQNHLEGEVRWIGMQLKRDEMSEIYRVIADHQGILINFARFEAFGRSVLEAMRSGLPVFVTEFGGLAEMIEDGENGFYINPTDFDGTAWKILEFIQQSENDPQVWLNISEQTIQRIDRLCNWQQHVKQLLLFARTYGFWDYISYSGREALQCYLDSLFHLLYKPRAAQISSQTKY
jgi:sucrose synthase